MTLGSDAAIAVSLGLTDDEWEETTLPIGARAYPVRRTPLARGTVPPRGQEEPASAEELRALRDVLVDAGCTALDTVMRVTRWEIDELEAFARETGVSPGNLFQPGLARCALDIVEGPGRLTGLALDAVGAVVSERLVAAGARGIRPMARAFAGLDPFIDQALSELATAARQARPGVPRRVARQLHDWALAERAHAAAIRPIAGKLTNALLTLWVVKSCDGASRPRTGVDELSWRNACRRLFGVGVVPPNMMARLELEAMWIDMGLSVNGPIDWPAGGIGQGMALFTYAANPRALAVSLEGHSKESPRYRHIAGGGRFRLRFRFTVRQPSAPDGAAALAEIEYDLELRGEPSRDQITR
jgi:hypothetical protein